MTTITLKLPDEKAEQLSEAARKMNMTLEQLVVTSVDERLSERKKYVSQAIKRIIKENEELYRRLA
jgi:predicted transcriptional regulator